MIISAALPLEAACSDGIVTYFSHCINRLYCRYLHCCCLLVWLISFVFMSLRTTFQISHDSFSHFSRPKWIKFGNHWCFTIFFRFQANCCNAKRRRRKAMRPKSCQNHGLFAPVKFKEHFKCFSEFLKFNVSLPTSAILLAVDCLVLSKRRH